MFKVLFLLGLAIPLLDVVSAGDFHTSDEKNLFYVEKDLKLNWYDANHLCISKNMSLITPDTEQKQLEITKLIKSFSSMNAVWTAGQEIENYNFSWITTGNKVVYSKWRQNEPVRQGTNEHQCIGIYTDEWACYRCTGLRNVICEVPPIVKKKETELDKLKNDYEKQTNKKLEELKKYYEKDIPVITKGAIEPKALQQNSQEFNELKLQHQQQLMQLLEVKKSLELKTQENEMLKKFHEEKLQLLEKNHKEALDSVKTTCGLVANHTSLIKNYSMIFNAQPNRN